MLSQTFAHRVKEAREAKGMAQYDVAQALGLRGVTTVWRWEKAEAFPSVDTIERLSEVLGQPAHWFFQEESNTGATASATSKPDSTDAPKVNELAPARKGRRKLSGRPGAPIWLAPTICELPLAV